MMMIYRCFLLNVLVFLIHVGSANGQNTISVAKGYYRNPMNIPMILSANFGELRSNHFHSGIDIKTRGVEGEPVYAVADGFVSRIGIIPTGFGRALYIAHRNGTTTVYGHLKSFTEPIENYATDYRYSHKRHNVDLFPDSGLFPVRRGDLIGYAGNSGMSYGPHLHFEVRESAMQRPVNLISAGYYTVEDTSAPTIEELYWISTDTVRGVPLSGSPRPIGVKAIGVGRGPVVDYQSVDTAAFEVSGSGYFVVRVTDRKNQANNTMGIYRIVAKAENEKFFEFKNDRFQFANSRYINSVAYYPMQRGSRMENFRLAVQANNFIPSYNGVRNRGVISVAPKKRKNISIEVHDDNANVSTLSFVIRGKDLVAEPLAHSRVAVDSVGVVANCKRVFNYSADGCSVSIGAGALYESIFYDQSAAAPPVTTKTLPHGIVPLTKIYTLHRDDVPLHKSMSVSIAIDAPEAVRSKLTLARLSANGSTYYYAGGRWENGAVATSTRTFGRYTVVTDSVPPTILPSFKDSEVLSGKSSLSFVIGDNFSGIASFIGTIDGQWILFEYDVLRRRITHMFDSKRIAMGGRRHSIQLEVVDNMGNTSLFDGGFIR